MDDRSGRDVMVVDRQLTRLTSAGSVPTATPPSPSRLSMPRHPTG
jgi:hypothetical protein